MFGKVMSISDDLMWRYFELLSFRPMQEIEALRSSIEDGANPRDIKFQLAGELVGRFHSHEEAEKAQQQFVARFQKGVMPDEIEECRVACEVDGLPIANLLRDCGLVKGTSEAMRMIKQGAVRIDGARVSDLKLLCVSGTTHVYQVGKRRFKRVSIG